MHDSWIFIREFGLFFAACLTQTKQNNCDLSTVSKRGEIGAVLTCPKLAKWTLNLNYSKSAKWTIWKSLSPVMEKLETSIWTAGKHHWMGSIGHSSLAHYHMANILSWVTEGLLLSNLGHKSNSVIEVDRALLNWG